MAKRKYVNIPVRPEVYEDLAMIAEANGLGKRGIGAQVENWVKRELPVCDHEKRPVSIETFPNQTLLGGMTSSLKNGWFCPTCNRVYQYSDVVMPEVAIKKQVEKQVKNDAQAVTA